MFERHGLMASSAAASSFAELTDKAHCAITVDAGERPYQGIVEIQGESLSSSLEHYFDRSVQVLSHVALVANENVAAGILLQQMPGQPVDEDDWNRLHFLLETLTAKDFDGDAGLNLIRLKLVLLKMTFVFVKRGRLTSGVGVRIRRLKTF